MKQNKNTEIEEIENEEEVQMRKDEYTKHPLYKVLQLYTEELEEFIEKKQKRHE